ncbi:cysteinyl leukotriene receptor 1 [Ambystoma mexicanum]|uniref:cysteinyl leukotriene receptor 1 n=1 Tax=Ambystoma mexicanum TaxID=8296 RepID=UPI0037E958B8
MNMETLGNLTRSTNASCPTIDSFRNQVYSAAYSTFCVFGFFGNGFALLILIKTYKEKTAFHIYMLNLAMSDLLFVFTLPLRVVYYVYNGNWFFGDFLCRITSFAFYVNLYCSIFMMTAMSFTRFIAIVFPVLNLKLVSVRKTKLVCTGIWIFVTVSSIPFLLTGSHRDITSGENKTKCFEPPPSKKSSTLFILNYVSLVFYFAIPFCIILVCYTLIIKTLLSNPMTKRQTRRKAVWMIIIVMTAFLVCFLPYHIQRTVHLQFLKGGKTCEEVVFMQKLVVITLAMAASNCCFDPMLYFFSGENFRRRISTLRKHSASSAKHAIARKKSLITADPSNDVFEEQTKESNES